MTLYDVANTEAYWTKNVEDNFKLGMNKAVVPASNVSYSEAKVIGSKLNVRVDISGTSYIFHKSDIGLHGDVR